MKIVKIKGAWLLHWCSKFQLDISSRLWVIEVWKVENQAHTTHTLREILLVVLTKRSQLYIFSKRYQKFCKTYQYLKVDGTKYATNFFL